jgi:acetate kinase
LNVLVFNCGSSSLNYKVYRTSGAGRKLEVIVRGKAHRVGVVGTESSFLEHLYAGHVEKITLPIKDHRSAAKLILNYIEKIGVQIDCIGHRFVHGGSFFQQSILLNPKVLETLESCIPLAPIHNPVSLSVIHESMKMHPSTPHYATFDTAFHSTIPEHAYRYALPKSYIEKHNYRKFGFHGLSYSYVIKEAANFFKTDLTKMNIIACHLGTGGASVVAVRSGSSIDTSMGYSPLSGLVMSTRAGDIDALLTIYLMIAYGYNPDTLMNLLTKKSGLLGISNFSSDIRDIIGRLADEQEQGQLAFDMYTHRLKKYIGGYMAALGRVDALIFTDEIGLQNPLVRKRVCSGMEWGGIMLDDELNEKAALDKISLISDEKSAVKIVTVPTDEELVIAMEGLSLLSAGGYVVNN